MVLYLAFDAGLHVVVFLGGAEAARERPGWLLWHEVIFIRHWFLSCHLFTYGLSLTLRVRFLLISFSWWTIA